MKKLTHINGRELSTIFPRGCSCGSSAAMKLEAFDEIAPTKETIQDITGGHGGIQADPLLSPRRITLRFAFCGTPKCNDEPLRVLRRIFKLGIDADDTVVLGYSEGNFPGTKPHWAIEAMVTDIAQIQETGRQNLLRIQVLLVAADPFFYGKSYQYTLTEGREVSGRTYPLLFPFTYGTVSYQGSKSVFLPGMAPCSPEITIYGPAVNPMLLNVTTAKFVRIKKTLTSSDVVTIDEDGVVKLNGQFKNSLRELGTRTPVLVPGVNEIVLLDDTDPKVDSNSPTADVSYTIRDA